MDMRRTLLLLLGARGGGEAWTPALPTSSGGVLPHTWHYAESPQLYTDAAKTTVARADDDIVYVSTSQGSDTHDIVQAVAGSRPTLKLDILNGHAVFRGDGDDWMRGAFDAPLAQPFTVLAVARLAVGGVNGGWMHICDGDDSDHRVSLLQYNATPDTWAAGAGGPYLYGGTTDSDWHIWLVVFNGASSQFWLDGVSQGAGDAGSDDLDGLTLLGNDAVASANHWLGDLAHYLAYPGNLSTADKNQLGNYAADYSGLSWTNLT